MTKHSEKFGEHTKLNTIKKLKIFKDIFESAISITNRFIDKKKNDSFLYYDLYAGEGINQDGKKGSPIIAIEAVKNFLDKNRNKNIKKFYFYFFEKDTKKCRKLENLTQDHIKDHQNNVICKIINSEWEIGISKCILNKNTYNGFCFADPYSAIELEKLSDYFNKLDYKFFDILIFSNFSALIRQTSDNQLIKFIPEEDIQEFTNSKDKKQSFFNIMKNRFSLKDLHATLFLPLTRNNALIDADNYSLSFFTNSFGMIDKFINSYNKHLIIQKKSSLYTDLREPILSAIERKNKIIDFFSLFQEILNNYVSYKNIKTRPQGRCPTQKNVISEVNQLIDEEKIVLIKNIDSKDKIKPLKNKKDALKVILKSAN